MYKCVNITIALFYQIGPNWEKGNNSVNNVNINKKITAHHLLSKYRNELKFCQAVLEMISGKNNLNKDNESVNKP